MQNAFAIPIYHYFASYSPLLIDDTCPTNATSLQVTATCLPLAAVFTARKKSEKTNFGKQLVYALSSRYY